MLAEKTLSTFIPANEKFDDLDISEMFDFKYKEDVERCFSLLKTNKLEQTERSIINVKSTDGLIDLSPCIGIYQEAVFFDNYQIDAAIKLKVLLNPKLKHLYTKEVQESSLDQKILFLVSLETKQKRYRTQVITPFVNEEQRALIIERLKTRLNQAEKAQVKCRIDFWGRENGEVKFSARGFADAETKKEIDSVYYIIEPEYRVGGMYSNELQSDKKKTRVINRRQALKEIKEWLNIYGVRKLFAYNACFDKKHLPEYSGYEWYDIMRLAAYRQYNRAILDSADCCKTGKLKRGYGVENIFRMLSKNEEYNETHNALLDAQDELKIMELLGCEIGEYDIAALGSKKLWERKNIVEGKINRATVE